MKNYDLLQFVVTPLGIPPQKLIDKVENDQLFNFLKDNINIFYNDIIYGKMMFWILDNFEPVFREHPSKWEDIKNKDIYLIQFLYLIVPVLHLKLFKIGKDVISPREAITFFLLELKVPNIEGLVYNLNSKEIVINAENILC